MFPAILFFVFAVVLVCASLGVILARNPVHSALLLVLCFFNSAVIWLLLDAEFLVYGQSVVVPGFKGQVPVSGPRPADIIAQRSQNAITLERTTCFGACPAYLLQIELSGNVFFMPGPPSNRHEVRQSTISAGQFHELVAGFGAIHFSELNDVYPGNDDLPSAYIGLTLDGKTKRIKHGDGAPPGLDELERTIERTANIHRWLHGDSERFTLQSPVAGPSSGGGGEDLKQEMYVRHDTFERIKPRISYGFCRC